MRIAVALSLGELEKRNPDILEQLKAHFTNESDEMVKRAFALGINKMNTPEAARALVELMKDSLNRSKPEEISLIAPALQRMGAMAIGELGALDSLLEQWFHMDGQSAGELEYTKNALIEEARLRYFNFKHSTGQPQARLLTFGRDSIVETDTTPDAIGSLKVIFDSRIHVSRTIIDLRGNTPPLETRCVIIEKEPHRYICIAVWDHFSSLELINRFESFVEGFFRSFKPKHEGSLRVEFGILSSSPDYQGRPDRYTRVIPDFAGDKIGVRLLSGESWFQGSFGADSAALRAYLRTPPAVPEGFLEFIKTL